MSHILTLDLPSYLLSVRLSVSGAQPLFPPHFSNIGVSLLMQERTHGLAQQSAPMAGGMAGEPQNLAISLPKLPALTMKPCRRLFLLGLSKKKPPTTKL